MKIDIGPVINCVGNGVRNTTGADNGSHTRHQRCQSKDDICFHYWGLYKARVNFFRIDSIFLKIKAVETTLFLEKVGFQYNKPSSLHLIWPLNLKSYALQVLCRKMLPMET